MKLRSLKNKVTIIDAGEIYLIKTKNKPTFLAWIKSIIFRRKI